MSEPVGVQFVRGEALPPNTVLVCRPTKFGNPFHAFRLKRKMEDQDLIPTEEKKDRSEKGKLHPEDACKFYLQWIDGEIPSSAAHDKGAVPPTREQIRRELRGKNLACYCPLGDPCHRDVLLKIANEP